jgi:DNA-directed RNA polymerase specialized sigma24 family protein
VAVEGIGSVTLWVREYIARGDEEAARRLSDRYFARMVGLARARLKRLRRPGVDQDAEDVAISALENFCRAARGGRFPLLKDRNDLWAMLITITERKAIDLVRREGRGKRGGGLEPVGGSAIDGMPAPEPTPEDLAIVVEQFQRLLDLLGDETLRQVALWRMEGHTIDEIADRLGCARRTVANRIALIRKRWSAELPP